MKKFFFPAMMALALSACQSTQTEMTQDKPTATAISNPGKIVWTDGKEDIQLAAAGQARCAPLSETELATALQQTNATRAKAGLKPMTVNAKLQKSAEKHACDMAGRGTMTHAGTSTKGPSARVKQEGYKPKITAENIAAGHTSSFGLVGTLNQWSASPNHNANIVIPQLNEMGIGRAVSADGKQNFWVAVYSAQR